MRGRPLVAKCSKCKRGKWGHARAIKGVERTDHVRYRACGRSVVHKRMMVCLDCGHRWWSTIR